MEPKGRDVHDLQAPVCTEARENIHQTISIIRRLITTGDLRYAYQLLPGVLGLEPVCLRDAEQRSCQASSTLPRQLQLVNRGVEADKRSFQPQCPSCTAELRYGNISVNPRGALQKGQWLTSLDLKDFYIGIHPPIDTTFASVKMAQHGNSQFCHVVSQSAREYLQKYSNQY